MPACPRVTSPHVLLKVAQVRVILRYDYKLADGAARLPRRNNCANQTGDGLAPIHNLNFLSGPQLREQLRK